MKEKTYQVILYGALLIVGTYFLFLGLYKARPFLIPLTIAGFLSLVMLPVANKLQSMGLSRTLSVLIADLIILIFCLAIIYVVGIEIKKVAEDWPAYQEKLEPKIEEVSQFVSEKIGLNKEHLTFHSGSENGSSSDSQKVKTISSFISEFFSFIGNFLLVFVYIFFFMYYREKFKNSILGFVRKESREKTDKILAALSKVSQQYMFGRFILILILAVIYTVGLAIVGIKYAALISILAAILSLIPYIGNVVGYGLALIMGAISTGDLGGIIGVSIVFAISQFVESYILEPFIVGQKVDLNPALTIIGVVMLGMVWGIVGAFIAIPAMAIVKVISDNVKLLRPLGYTLGTEDISTGPSWVKKVKNWKSKNDH